VHNGATLALDGQVKHYMAALFTDLLSYCAGEEPQCKTYALRHTKTLSNEPFDLPDLLDGLLGQVEEKKASKNSQTVRFGIRGSDE
jgi:hypothetical protein